MSYFRLTGIAADVPTRFVTLPDEAYGYRARESVQHTLWEMITWFEKNVKNAQ